VFDVVNQEIISKEKLKELKQSAGQFDLQRRRAGSDPGPLRL
jgi:hypothetical protein